MVQSKLLKDLDQGICNRVTSVGSVTFALNTEDLSHHVAHGPVSFQQVVPLAEADVCNSKWSENGSI